MSKAFGNLFGSKATPVQTQPTTFQTLPQFTQQAVQKAITGIEGLPTSAFAPAPLEQQTLAGISALEQAPVDITGQFAPTLQAFQNPFEQQVVEQSIADIERSGAGLLSDIGAGASAAGAFGGQRQGIAEAELGRNILEQVGRTSGALRAAGFETAADRALRSIGAQEDLRRQQALDLIQAGGLLQQQATQQAQAPLTRFESILGAGLGLAGGGGSQLRQNVGALQRIGQTAGSFGQAAKGFGLNQPTV